MTNQLPRSTPEAQGVPATALIAFLDAAEQLDTLHSLMLVRHGAVVAEGWWTPYAADQPHMMFSISKSFTATAIGMLLAEGRLALDDLVVSFFPDLAPAEPDARLAALRVRHLLTMASGHDVDVLNAEQHILLQQPGQSWMKAFFEQPLAYAPGEHFLYNSGASHMLSAIVQRITGATMFEYLQPRLFAPLGIEQALWETSPEGVTVGGWGLITTTEAIARFGQLYLQQGRWQDQQLLPAEWVEAASARQIANGSNPESDWEQGYGYQFWRCRHGVYRADGAFGQSCIIMPAYDAVLAITAGVADMQAVLNLVWEHILPAFQPAALPANPTMHAALTERLAKLALQPAQGNATSALIPAITGKRYVFAPNPLLVESMLFEFTAEGCTFTLRDPRGEHQLLCGNGAWRYGMTTLDIHGPMLVAASGTWSAADTYVMQVWFYHTPFCLTITCQCTQDRLICRYSLNVAFGPTVLPPIEGQQGAA